MSHNRKKRTKNKQENVNRSTIPQHHRQGTLLTPPLANLPKLSFSSWRDNRLPEMLWAVLLVSNLQRTDALNVFRELADYLSQFRGKETSRPSDITLSGLSEFDDKILIGALKIITRTQERIDAVTPLMLLKDFPAKTKWEKFLKAPSSEDWSRLMMAVAKTLDHQSQESTDCRWLRVICMMATGLLSLPTEEMAKEYIYYPDFGEQRKVRPSIRASEMAFNMMDEKQRSWSPKFWEQCLSDTPCFPLPDKSTDSPPIVGTTPNLVKKTYLSLVNYCSETTVTTETNAKHDTVFGIALYSLGILQELLRIGASQSITSRLALRTLSECYITLAYLTKKDNPELWKSYRVFGAGQAKLQFLKFEEMDELPGYVHSDTLSVLANEDVWEEFLLIELGHWEKANLRDISIQADVKDIYDKFYGWTSSFSHGHWGAIRDSVFDTCANPLHRLHRIPRNTTRALPDVIPDTCYLVDEILELLSINYPTFSERVTMAESSESPKSA